MSLTLPVLRPATPTQTAFNSHIKAHGNPNSAYLVLKFSEDRDETLNLAGREDRQHTRRVGILIKLRGLCMRTDAMVQNGLCHELRALPCVGKNRPLFQQSRAYHLEYMTRSPWSCPNRISNL